MKLNWAPYILIIVCFASCHSGNEIKHDQIQINPEIEYQRIYGFGTSMINYKEFPAEYFDEDFLDMVVYDLGLSILRIPITEHLEFVNDDDDPDHFNWDAFYLSNNNRRKGMTETFRFVSEFKKRGVNQFLASPWSPPQYMKTNRAPIQGGFLRSDMYDEYAEYLAAYIMLAKKNWDIDIDWISLQNECVFIEFYRSCLYHGYGMKEALQAVSEKFSREQIHTKLLINEDVLFPERVHAFLEPVFADPDTKDFNGDIAVHRKARGKELSRWIELTKDFNREYHMTETSGHQTTWKGAMNMAVDMHEYLTLGNFSSWIYWQISGNTGGSDPGFFTLMMHGKPTSKYYAAKHYYRYVRPGAIRVQASSQNDSVLVSAFKQPENGNMTLVLINSASTSSSVEIAPNRQLPSKMKYHRSTETDMFSEEEIYRTGNILTLPPKSITSLTGLNRSLKDPGKVMVHSEAWTDPEENGKRIGTDDAFPMKSEWQRASDGHAGRLILAEEAALSGTINKQRADGWTLLHEAIVDGDGDAANYLIMNGADINLAANDGWTPMHAAASGFAGNQGIQIKYKEYTPYEIFRMLLDAGADVRACTRDGWTPLHCAVANANTGYKQDESSSMNRISDLISAGADIEAKDVNGRTPLHWAAMQGYSHFIDEKTIVEGDVEALLIKSGASLNVTDKYGRTALHYAVEIGYESIVSELVKGHASVAIHDLEDKTPIDIAIEERAGSILKILKKQSIANLSPIDKIKNPHSKIAVNLEIRLMKVAITGNEKELKQLLKEGADIQYRDSDGFKAIDRARDNGHQTIVDILTQAGQSL